jgi:2-polyprenyl-3-methyl-5-hydroxy-6-metoxy-1,4-benzoquinol methylase
MFDDYLYVSSTNQTFRDHFSTMADRFIQEFDLNQESFVLDIGSNDGVFLSPLKENGIKILGVDPAENLVNLAGSTQWFFYKTLFFLTWLEVKGSTKIMV